jgi:hypothetical protein
MLHSPTAGVEGLLNGAVNPEIKLATAYQEMKTVDDYVYTIILRMLNNRIKKAEENATSEYSLNNIDYNDGNGAEYVESKLLIARATAVKDFTNTLAKTYRDIIEKYNEEMNSSREEIYPRNWMNKDDRIKTTFKKYPLLVPLLNVIDRESRGVRGNDYRKMVALTNIVTKKKKFECLDSQGKVVKRNWAVFVANKDFYGIFRHSKNNVQKHIQELCKWGILVKLGRTKNGGMLYADGYYTQWDDKLVKHNFLKENKAFVNALRNFKPAYRKRGVAAT